MLTISNLLRCQKLAKIPVMLSLAKGWRKEPIKVTWEKPETGWTKLNFDGSCKGKTGKSSVGGVLRNDKAEFVLGFAETIGSSTSTMAELAALRRGLELVIENGWNDRVWFEGDSKCVLEMIARKRPVKCDEAEMHVRDINLMVTAFSGCFVSHIYREGNRAADRFAQLGHNLKKPEVWHDDPPRYVLPIIRNDAEGKGVLRRR